MGGRGTFAVGNSVPYNYKTVDKIDGIKVLKGTEGKHGLPEESHSSSKYISLFKNGTVKQIRVYNKDHTARVDIEYSIHRGEKRLHAHDYVGGERRGIRELSKAEFLKYSKFFGGKK